MSDYNPKNNKQEMKEGLVRLSHFNPSYTDDYGNQVLDYFVLDALSSYENGISTTPTILKEIIKDTFLLDFDEAEIDASSRRLSEKGIVDYKSGKNRGTPPTIIIDASQKDKIHKNLNEIRKLEVDVYAEWHYELKSKYKKLSLVIEHFKEIDVALRYFISEILLQHGIQSVSLLYPESEKTNIWLDSIENNIFENIKGIDKELGNILRIELPLFLQSCDPKRRKYIVNLFNSSFYWHLVHLDSRCSNLMRNVISGQRLYLDNNILYSCVGLDGAYVLKAVHSLLTYANDLEYELWVTSKTIDEFHNSLNWRIKNSSHRPKTPRQLAEIAIQVLKPNNFIVTYWNEFVQTGLTIEEFINEKSYLEPILSALNIQVSNEFREEIENSEEIKDEMSILNDMCNGQLHENIVEHDSFHRILIKKIRKGYKHHFSDAKAWFLTNDSKLPKYGRIAQRGKHYLPFCITSDEWIQINRPLLVRTVNQEDYEKSFHAIISQPFLRSMIPINNLDTQYENIIAKLSKFENMNPHIALRIITDNHFMSTLLHIENDEMLDEMLENQFVNIAEELLDENIELESKLKSSTIELKKLRTDLSKLEDALAQYKQQNNNVEKIVKDLQKTLGYDKEVSEKEKEIRAQLEDKLALIKKEKSESENRYNSQIMIAENLRKRINWIIFILINGFSIWIIWFGSLIEIFNAQSSFRFFWLIKLLFSAIILFSSLPILKPKHLMTFLTISVAIALALITIILTH